MRAKTKDGERLKRLANKFATTSSLWTWANEFGTSAGREIAQENMYKARKRLFDEIDRLTSLDLTPRAIQDM